MTYLDSVDPGELRIVLAFDFQPHADPDDVLLFKEQLLGSMNTVHGIETTGSFQLIIELSAPTLSWYSDWLKELASPLARLVERYEESFVCKRFIRRRKDETCIWVSTHKSIKRLDERYIDKVAAEGDYVRIHCGNDSWLVHATLHSVLEKLSSERFVQIHRSLLLRRQFIDELRREGNHWLACLGDGTTQRVAKSHVADALQGTRGRSMALAD